MLIVEEEEEGRKSLGESLSSIQSMIQQEVKSYQFQDYLQDSILVAPQHRKMMAEWCNYIADYIGYSHETVEIAMNCFDRFASTPEGRNVLDDRNLFERGVITSLYTVTKIHEQKFLGLDDLEVICKGKHSQEDFKLMELRILGSLDWKLNPPTSMCFVRTLLDLFPFNDTSNNKELVIEIASHQVQHAMLEYDICRKGAFQIAFAALLNGLQIVTTDERVCERYAESLVSRVSNLAKNPFLSDLRDELYQVIPTEMKPENDTLNSTSTSSLVSYGVQHTSMFNNRSQLYTPATRQTAQQAPAG